ncbi:MAG: hypothetical protein SF069_13515 [Phycisphaerae bacterium]|nr:hypothetical protein [Phycisphaerae bacterium]
MRWLTLLGIAILLLAGWSTFDLVRAMLRGDGQQTRSVSHNSRVAPSSPPAAPGHEEPADIPVAPASESDRSVGERRQDRLRELATIVERDPYNERALRDMLALLREAEDWDAIAETCRRLLILSPDDAELAALREQALRNTGDGRALLDALAAETTARPTDVAVWIRYGSALIDAGRVHDAIDAFTKAIELEPELRNQLLATRGAAYARLKIWDSAAGDLEQSSLSKTDAESALTLSQAYAELSRWDDAAPLLDRWRAARPRDVRFLNLAAEIAWRRHIRGDGTEHAENARRLWIASLDLAPGQSEVRQRLLDSGGLPLKP